MRVIYARAGAHVRVFYARVRVSLPGLAGVHWAHLVCQSSNRFERVDLVHSLALGCLQRIKHVQPQPSKLGSGLIRPGFCDLTTSRQLQRIVTLLFLSAAPCVYTGSIGIKPDSNRNHLAAGPYGTLPRSVKSRRTLSAD